jgi:hypothetical protein
MARSRLAALLVALALLAPASAFAQSAGDEQYADPFGDNQEQSNDQGSTPSTAPPTTSAQAAPTATPAPATSAPTATTAQAPPAGAQLPRTGGDPITPAVAGFWLLLGGVALRARVRQR